MRGGAQCDSVIGYLFLQGALYMRLEVTQIGSRYQIDLKFLSGRGPNSEQMGHWCGNELQTA